MLKQLMRLSNDGRRVYMTGIPKADEDSPEVEKKHIISWLVDNNVASYFRFEDTIDFILKKINVFNDPWDGDLEDVIVAERRDATVISRIDDDKMTAFLRVNGACGGNAILGNDLLDVLKNAQIIRGVKKQTLQKLLTVSSRLKPGEYLEVLVAAGKLPIMGDDSKIVYLVQDSKSRVLRPQDRDDGTVDMRDLGNIITVKEGQPLAKRILSTRGIDGFLIDGSVLTTIPGEDIDLKVYPGSQLSSHDENIIVASIVGLPILKSDGVEVDNALCLKAVTVATGHINFEGSVIINGDVNAGMKVQATGSITVGGVVETCILEAGGDIVIHNGILGKKVQISQEMTTLIKAKGSVVVKFAQYANIEADGDIIINQHAMHCNTRTESNLQICDQAKRTGTLTGGSHVARCGVIVVTLGATSGVVTRVHAFTLLGELLADRIEVTKDLDHEHSQLIKVKNAELKLLQQPENKRPDQLLERLEWTKLHHLERISELKVKIESNHIELDALYRSHTIDVLKNCFSGVHCHIGDMALAIDNEHGRCRFVTNGKEVVVEPFI